MSKNKPVYLSPPTRKEISLTEKAVYIKKHLHMTSSPAGGNYTEEQIDRMIYLVNNKWKESGYHFHEWIETVYFDIIEKNK